MKKTILTGLSILSCAGLLSARTWTSSDGEKTFEAEYVSHNDSEVTVMKGSKKLTFKLELLSETDQTWTKEQVVAAGEEATDSELESITDTLNKYLVKFDGRRYKSHKIEKEPEYYLVYFAASW